MSYVDAVLMFWLHGNCCLQGECEIGGGSELICSGSVDKSVEQSSIEWDRVMWLRRRVGRIEVKPDFADFISLITIDVGVFNYFDGFPDEEEMIICMGVCKDFYFIEVDPVFSLG
jgi:hypothetical protein